MTKKTAWRAYRGREKCPICGHAGWCGATTDGAVVHCMRVASDRSCKKGGWLHFNRDKAQPQSRPWTQAPKEAVRIDVPGMMGRWLERTQASQRAELAASLGVSVDSVERLSAAWAVEYSAWAFPMSDSAGNWCGVRLRNTAGEKWAVKGSTSGLFLPDRWNFNGPIVIVEGPTDSAAVLDLGFDVIGRPSCNSGNDLVAGVLKAFRRDVVILANLDEAKHRPDGGVFYPGQDGANLLADQIVRVCASLKIITPPNGIKDARAWLCDGGTRRDVLEFIGAKSQWRPTKK